MPICKPYITYRFTLRRHLGFSSPWSPSGLDANLLGLFFASRLDFWAVVPIKLTVCRRKRTRPGLGLSELCLPSPAKTPPSGPARLHENKHDGFPDSGVTPAQTSATRSIKQMADYNPHVDELQRARDRELAQRREVAKAAGPTIRRGPCGRDAR